MPFVQFPLGPDDLDLKKSVGPQPLPQAEAQAQARAQAAQPQAAQPQPQTPQSPLRNANIGTDGMSSEGRAWQQQQQARSMGPTPQASATGGVSPIRQAGNAATRIRGAMPQKLGIAGGIGGAVSAMPEAAKVASVALNKNSSGVDVATQAAEGVGRVGASTAGAALGAKAGAVLGAFGGPAAPFTVPLGVALGGAAGGTLGNYLADKAITSGRTALGGDAASPVDRLSAPQTQTPTTQPAPTAAQPGPDMSPEAQVARAEQARVAREGTGQPQGPATPRQVGEQIFRSGNSFGDSPEAAAWGARTTPINTQNMAAANNLGAAQQQASLGRVAQQEQAQQQQAGLRNAFPGAPRISHSGNDYSARENLRKLKSAAEWEYSTAKRKKYAMQSPAMMAYAEAVKQDSAARYGQAGLDADVLKSNIGANASRYASDTQRRAADMRFAGDMAQAQATRGAAAASAQRDERDRTDKRKDVTRKMLNDRFTTAATGRDGQVDHGLLNQLHSNVTSYIGRAADDAERAGNPALAEQLRQQGEGALEDPSMLNQYLQAIKLDQAQRRGAGITGGTYVGNGNPGLKRLGEKSGGFMGLGAQYQVEGGGTVPAHAVEFEDGNFFSPWNPWARRTNEFDILKTNRKGGQ